MIRVSVYHRGGSRACRTRPYNHVSLSVAERGMKRAGETPALQNYLAKLATAAASLS